jgi:hypothetical protein
MLIPFVKSPEFCVPAADMRSSLSMSQVELAPGGHSGAASSAGLDDVGCVCEPALTHQAKSDQLAEPVPTPALTQQIHDTSVSTYALHGSLDPWAKRRQTARIWLSERSHA